MKKIIATFKVTDDAGDLIKMYTMTAMDHTDLYVMTQLCREVWDEYHVEVETDMFTQSFSHIYKQEVMLGLAS
jgi:hypothetical protein